MRKLKTSDVFAGMRLLASIDVTDDIKKLVISKEMKAEDIGFTIICTILNKASQCRAENAFYEFIAPLLEVPVEEVPEMDPTDLMDSIEKMASVDRWKAFFQRVASLMQLN